MSLQFAPVSGPMPGIAAQADPAAAPVRPAAPEPASDLMLARQGNREAFARLVRAHQARVFSVALRLTGRREDAEELAQDVFIQLHRALQQLQDDAHLTHWLLRTVTHRSIDRLRQRERQPRLVPLDAASENVAAEQEADPQSARRLQVMLQLLPVPARVVVLLRYQEDLDPTDISALLDMPLNTVKSHLRRSLDALRTLHGGHPDEH